MQHHGRPPQLKSTSRAVNSPGGINSHLFMTKVGLQVGGYWLLFNQWGWEWSGLFAQDTLHINEYCPSFQLRFMEGTGQVLICTVTL